MWRKWLKWGALGMVGLFLVIQLVPYGRDHGNPAVAAEPQWDSPRTRELAMRACGDCHSNETTWPWYSNVAPMSWLVQSDVDSGRSTMNFSEWGFGGERTREVGESIREGSMPPVYYTWLHSGAKLSDQEKQELIDGFAATFGNR